MKINEKSERIKAARQSRPSATLAEIGAEIGVSRERVRQVLAAAGMPTVGKGRSRKGVPRFNLPRKADCQRHPPRWGAGINSHACGRVTEIYAALDLTKRGYDVFCPLHSATICDLIIVHRKNPDRLPMRVEVKFGKRSSKGFSYVHPKPGLYDLLAVVFADGSVEYRACADLVTAVFP